MNKTKLLCLTLLAFFKMAAMEYPKKVATFECGPYGCFDSFNYVWKSKFGKVSTDQNGSWCNLYTDNHTRVNLNKVAKIILPKLALTNSILQEDIDTLNQTIQSAIIEELNL